MLDGVVWVQWSPLAAAWGHAGGGWPLGLTAAVAVLLALAIDRLRACTPWC